VQQAAQFHYISQGTSPARWKRRWATRPEPV